MSVSEPERRATAIARHEARISVYVGPHVERQKAAEAHAVSYAQEALKAMLLLHGGALVAYPAFMDSARLSNIVAFSSLSLVLPIAVHAAGLILAATAFALAFHYMAGLLRIWRLCEDRDRASLRSILMKELGVPPPPTDATSEVANAIRDVQRKAGRLEVIAIFAFYGSVACFLVGVVLGLWTIALAGPLHIPDSL